MAQPAPASAVLATRTRHTKGQGGPDGNSCIAPGACFHASQAGGALHSAWWPGGRTTASALRGPSPPITHCAACHASKAEAYLCRCRAGNGWRQHPQMSSSGSSAGSERVRCPSAPVHVPQVGCKHRSARVTHRNGAAGGGARRVRGAGAEVDVADWRLRLGVKAAVHLRNVVRRVCQQQLRIGGLCADCKHVFRKPVGYEGTSLRESHGAGVLTTWHACAAMRCDC